MSVNREEMKNRLKESGSELGAVAVRVASLKLPLWVGERLDAWVASGRHASMEYLAKKRKKDAQSLFPEARSMVCVAMPYFLSTPICKEGGLWGLLASYARGKDYHVKMHELLRTLGGLLQQWHGTKVAQRAFVDGAPLMERAFAASCGLGKVGKNRLLFVKGWGSAVVLGELLVSLELPPDEPDESPDFCGDCTACLEACPTGALEDGTCFDARRCLAHALVEDHGVISSELAKISGNRIFGCDVCLEACPHNVSAQTSSQGMEQDEAFWDLEHLGELGTNELARLLRNTTLRRLGPKYLRRNIAIAAGNLAGGKAIALLKRLVTKGSPVTRMQALLALSSQNSAFS